jgi:hypothetical protein
MEVTAELCLHSEDEAVVADPAPADDPAGEGDMSPGAKYAPSALSA